MVRQGRQGVSRTFAGLLLILDRAQRFKLIRLPQRTLHRVTVRLLNRFGGSVDRLRRLAQEPPRARCRITYLGGTCLQQCACAAEYDHWLVAMHLTFVENRPVGTRMPRALRRLAPRPDAANHPDV